MIPSLKVAIYIWVECVNSHCRLWLMVTFHCRGPARVVGFCLIPSSTRHLHRTRSSASAPSRSSHLRSEFIISHHLCFGLPLDQTPSTVISDTLRMSSSLSLPFPYHCIRLFLIRSLIGITLASAVISSFGLRSSKV